MNPGTTAFRSILPVLAVFCGTAAPLRAAQFEVAITGDGKGAGSAVTVPIATNAEVTVGAAQFELIYDPARLRWVGGEAGKLTANALVDANLLGPGRVKVAFAGGEDVRGTGVIFHAKFEWIGSDKGATSIRFAGVRAWDQGSGLELSTAASPGSVVPAIDVPATQAGAEKPAGDAPPTPSNTLIYLGIGCLALFLIVTAVLVMRKKSGT